MIVGGYFECGIDDIDKAINEFDARHNHFDAAWTFFIVFTEGIWAELVYGRASSTVVVSGFRTRFFWFNLEVLIVVEVDKQREEVGDHEIEYKSYDNLTEWLLDSDHDLSCCFPSFYNLDIINCTFWKCRAKARLRTVGWSSPLPRSLCIRCSKWSQCQRWNISPGNTSSKGTRWSNSCQK